MNHFYRLALLAAPAAALLTGCIDDNYDLSDIDTTTELKVNDLTIPVNIDEIKLDEIITLSEGSKIKDYNGSYALLENGDFESSPIEIAEVKARAPKLPDSSVAVMLNSSNAPRGAKALSFKIMENHAPFSYNVSGVDEAIHSINSVEISPLTLTIIVDAQSISSIVKNFSIENLMVQFPKGMTAKADNGTYDPATGVLSISSLTAKNGKVEISISTTAIDLTKNDAGISASHVFHFASEMSIIGGDLVINDSNINITDLPSNISFKTSYTLTDLNLKTITGSIDYSVKGVDISPIDLSDLPDFLNQDGTDIFLANPQIYISLSNPLYEYNLRYQAGLTITAERQGEADKSFSINDPYFTVGGNRQVSALVFSPKSPTAFYPGYEDATHVGYTSLSNVLAGNRLPSRLRVSVTDPTVPLQSVTNFRLGTVIGAVKGKWQVVAPLALKPESVIIYSKLENGWNDEDVDAIKISNLEVSANVSTDLPIGATLTGYPVDKEGNKLTGVEVIPVELNANASNQTVVIRVEGTIEHLDGFFFKVVAHPDSEDALGPNQTIKLNNVRARVSGSYLKKF